MKEIKLTQGKVAIVDDEDVERVNQFRWFIVRGKYVALHLVRVGIIRLDDSGRSLGRSYARNVGR